MDNTPVAIRPLGVDNGTLLGAYRVAQLSGAIAATPTALDVHARIRWPIATGAVAVVTGIKVGWHCISAITTAVRMSYQASIVRRFTVDSTTAVTLIDMSNVPRTGQMRSNGSQSLMGANGPGICTTAPITGHTYVLDNAPFAFTTWTVPGILTGTATVVAAVAGPMQSLYEWKGVGVPPTLNYLEGIAIQLTHTGHATGTVSLAVEWEWQEYSSSPF